MIGFDLGLDKLIEIVVLVIDVDLNIFGDGVDVVMYVDDVVLLGMIDVVVEMYLWLGLIDEVKVFMVDLVIVEVMVFDYINEYVK